MSESISLVVGIGASAGGLEAFKSFFSAMPADSGMAFVLVQHLDPDHASALVAIVQGSTRMEVFGAEDGTALAPNRVYVIPPDSVLRLEGGRLRLTRPAPTLARRASINTFLTSLAEDQGDKAVGIILSGFGSDGAHGVEAIKEHGGLTLSQAEFDHAPKLGMPESATATGWVDHVLPVQAMPACLLEHARFRAVFEGSDLEQMHQAVVDHLGAISAILNSRLGRDFSQYKTNTIMRRVQRRMQVLRIDTVPAYIDALRKRPEEPELLFREVLIRVTRFFRDPPAFQALAGKCVADLLGAGRGQDPIRVWVPGCATGEEAYSLAILFKEAMALADQPRRIQIFATDIDDQAVTLARAGLYPDSIVADVSAERLERYFSKDGDQYRVAKDLREMCLFSIHDLVKDPPFSRLDLISCRNLMIYFAPPLQKRVVQMFHYGLKPDGMLFLGSSEALTAHSKLFGPIDKKHRLSRRLAGAGGPMPLPAAGPRSAVDREGLGPADPERRPEVARALEQFTPAHVIIDAKQDVQRFFGPVAKYLEPAAGPASFNVLKLAHTSLRIPLRAALKRATATGLRVVEPGLELHLADRIETVNLVIEPLGEQDGESGLILVAFQDSPFARAGSVGSDVRTDDLSRTHEQLQTITEELETANEELQSSNEEYQSVNEELQSANEELETSKEELQSINEELQAVNAELASRNETLVDLNSDLSNLIDSTSIATLFLDGEMRIKRFTPTLLSLFNVRSGDEGRPIADIVSQLARDGLERDARQVIRTLVPVEREVAVVEGDRSYQMTMRPYRDINNVINGVVITFVDISERKQAEASRARLAAIVDSTDDAILAKDLNGVITNWNRSAERLFGYSSEEAVGQHVTMLIPPDRLDEEAVIQTSLRKGEAVDHLETVRRRKDGGLIEVSLTVSPIKASDGAIIGASKIARDITQQKRDQKQAALLLAELDHRVKNILAVVSSVVTQTVKSAQTPQDLATSIEGRIAAIAKAHSLMTNGGTAGASLAALFHTELAPHRRADRVSVSGPDIDLTPRAGMALSLTIHELTTNAVKYGALSSGAGRLDVHWDVTGGGDAPVLRIDWTEANGPPVSPPSRNGFGAILIERALTYEFDARVKREFQPSGLVCRIEMALTDEVSQAVVAEGGSNP